MPGPAVYAVVAVVGVVAVGLAFHEFVYEPHIAPKVEAWAESYVRRRKERRQQARGPILTHPVEHRDENDARRFIDRRDDATAGNTSGMSMSFELEELARRERSLWGQVPNTSGLHRRRPGGSLHESDVNITNPTHVLFDTSTPTSPGTSTLSSVENSPVHAAIVLSEPSPGPPRPPSPRSLSPRLPTPISQYSAPSSRAVTPVVMSPERSPLSTRRPIPDASASQALTSAYNTPLGGSLLSENGRIPSNNQSASSSRVQSPFSDIYAADAHGFARESPVGSPRVRSPSISSDLTLESDDEFDIMSPRSGILTPAGRTDDDPFEDVLSQHGSDVSWTSVGRHSSPGR